MSQRDLLLRKWSLMNQMLVGSNFLFIKDKLVIEDIILFKIVIQWF